MAEKTTDNSNYFDPEKYNTIRISDDDINETSKKKQTVSTTLLNLLNNPEHKEFKHQTLALLKKDPKNLDVLMEAIKDKKVLKNKHILIAAVWESGMDGSKYLSDFVTIVIENPFQEAMEALTVIEDMQGAFDTKELANNIQKMEKAISKNTVKEKFFLLQTTLDKLNDFKG